MGVEPVGVDQQGRLDRARHAAGELLGARVAAEARAERHGAGALGHLLDHLDPCRGVEAVRVGQPAAHLLEQPQLDDLLHRGGHRDLHVARPGALCGAGRHRGRAGEAARAAHHHEHAGDELRPAGGAARVEVEHALGDQPARGAGRAARDADLDDLDTAGVLLAGVDVEAELGAVEGGGGGGANGLRLDLAGARVDARGDVAGDHGGVLGVDRGDRGGERLARRALEAGAEQGVDDRAGACRAVAASKGSGGRPGRRWRLARASPFSSSEVGRREHVDLVAVLAQQPRHHEAIAPVVALADDDPDRARAAPRRRSPARAPRRPAPSGRARAPAAARSPRRRRRASQRRQRGDRARAAFRCAGCQLRGGVSSFSRIPRETRQAPLARAAPGCCCLSGLQQRDRAGRRVGVRQRDRSASRPAQPRARRRRRPERTWARRRWPPPPRRASSRRSCPAPWPPPPWRRSAPPGAGRAGRVRPRRPARRR